MSEHAPGGRCAAFRAAIATSLVVLAAGGCATPAPRQAHVEYGPDPIACTRMTSQTDRGRPATLVDQHIADAALAQLAAKGYPDDDANADCAVVARLADGPAARPRSGTSLGLGVGGGSGRVGGGVGLSVPLGRGSTATPLALTLDIVDLRRSAQVWSGSVEAAMSVPQPTREEIERAVQQVLWQFPDRMPAAPGR